jgi:hypothetical protein
VCAKVFAFSFPSFEGSRWLARFPVPQSTDSVGWEGVGVPCPDRKYNGPDFMGDRGRFSAYPECGINTRNSLQSF